MGRATWIWLLTCAACGDDVAVEPDPTDAATPLDVATTPITPPAAPRATLLPDMRPCREGWGARPLESGATICDPFPSGAMECEGATAQYPGEPSCHPLGEPCPSNGFADGLPEGTIFVRAGASGGAGDGSREHPYESLSEAIAVAGDGATIALAPGVYEGRLELSRSLDLVGACTGETRIEWNESTSPDVPTYALVIGSGARVTARDLTLSALRANAVKIDGSFLALDRVVVESPTAAVTVLNGSLQSRDTGLRGSFALNATRSTLDVERMDASGVVYVAEGDASLRRTTIRSSGASISLHGQVELHELAIVSAHDGLDAASAADVVADDVFVRSSEVPLRVAGRARVALTRASFGSSLSMVSPDALSFSSISTSDTLSLEDVTFEGLQLFVGDGPDDTESTALVVARTSIEHGPEAGLTLSTRANLTGHDLTVFRTERFDTPLAVAPAIGILVDANATLSLEGATIERSEQGGVYVLGSAHFEDLVVRNSGGGTRDGFGVIAENGVLSLVRARLEGSVRVGLAALGSARISGSDVEIVDTLPEERRFGRGIEADEGRIELERVRVRGTHDHGVLAAQRAMVSLRDVSILESASLECASDDCADSPFGFGVGAYDAEVTLRNFEIDHASLCGLYAGASATLTVDAGVIAACGIGVCIEDESIDLDALTREVDLQDNETSASTRTAPVPEPITPPDL